MKNMDASSRGLYASTTEVPVERSKAEIEKILKRYGATEFASGWDHKRAVVMFCMNDRRIRFFLPMPDRQQFRSTPGGQTRNSEFAIDAAYEQAQRQKWRALSLAIKAKLEIVASDITAFEEEFMSYTVMPNGQNFSEWARPQITEALAKKKMPPLLEAGTNP